jgi:hypothetical protein
MNNSKEDNSEDSIKELVNLKYNIYKHIDELEKYIIYEKERINQIEKN